MKNTNFLILSILFSALLTSGCRTEVDYLAKKPEGQLTAIIESAKLWHFQNLDKKKPKERQLSPIWDDSWLELSTSGKELLVVPAKENKVNNTRVTIRRVFIFDASEGTISDGRIVELIGHDYNVWENLIFLVKNYDRDVIDNFNGGIIQYDVNYRQLASAVYQEGSRLENSTTKIVTVSGTELKEMMKKQ